MRNIYFDTNPLKIPFSFVPNYFFSISFCFERFFIVLSLIVCFLFSAICHSSDLYYRTLNNAPRYVGVFIGVEIVINGTIEYMCSLNQIRF